ncbi:MAG TPA: phosphate ABC transporter substrate-binding protein [Thermoanaerobaculia bacterium]|nr:phosphate ABC transporter substrate-binding protein [Thermoanaerobaculia bacterium]
MRNKTLSLLLLCSIALLPAGAASAAVKVVVHGSNPVASVTKAKAADLFLKRVTRWDNGRTVTPVDLAEKNPARAAFSKELLGKEVAWVKSYWQKMIFSGRATPPVELSSDAEVLDLVRGNPDAIGYVSESATLPAGVRALTISE